MAARIVRLDPLVRRAVSTQAEGSLRLSGTAPGSDVPRCLRCHGTGMAAVRTRGGTVYITCEECRTDALYLLVCPDGDGGWIAVRDLAHAWGRGSSPVEALLELERALGPGLSSFSPQFLRPDRLHRRAEGAHPEAAARAATFTGGR